jgi:hypothetical protein
MAMRASPYRAKHPFRIVDRRGFIVKVIHILQSINSITLIMKSINAGGIQ